jgi:hypothetical protein
MWNTNHTVWWGLVFPQIHKILTLSGVKDWESMQKKCALNPPRPLGPIITYTKYLIDVTGSDKKTSLNIYF